MKDIGGVCGGWKQVGCAGKVKETLCPLECPASRACANVRAAAVVDRFDSSTGWDPGVGISVYSVGSFTISSR